MNVSTNDTGIRIDDFENICNVPVYFNRTWLIYTLIYNNKWMARVMLQNCNLSHAP